MASCTRIDNSLQAYLDGELPQSERVIIERHVSDCTVCAQLLDQHRQSCVDMYESLGSERLSRDLVPYVMEHLPEMEFPKVDVSGLNYRAKHPSRIRDRFVRLVPIGIAAMLVFFTAVLKSNWPGPLVPEETLGLVTYRDGDAVRIQGSTLERSRASVKTYIEGDDRLETGPDGRLMFALVGPTNVKVGPDTRVHVRDQREISVEKGHVLVSVDGTKRLFKVLTPSGEITVFGTVFDVNVDSGSTRVVVEEGEVQVVHAEDDSVFTVIRGGQQLDVYLGAHILTPQAVVAEGVTEWAKEIVPDDAAETLFAARIVPRYEVSEVSGKNVYVIETWGRSINSVLFEWNAGNGWDRFCGYSVFVYDDRWAPIFSDRIDGRTLSDRNTRAHEIVNTGAEGKGSKFVFVKLIPDYTDGTEETDFEVTAKLNTP